MGFMQKIMSGVKVDELLDQVQSKPDLWDRYTMRTKLLPNSAHRDVQDIWIRYNDWSNFDPENPQDFSNEHESVYYSAYYEIPALKPIIEGIMAITDGAELGGVLLTKITAGKRVYPHKDSGWHVETYRNKVLLLLSSDKGQSFNFGEEKHEGQSGDVFLFDNRAEHEVINASDTDRISLILAIKPKGHNIE